MHNRRIVTGNCCATRTDMGGIIMRSVAILLIWGLLVAGLFYLIFDVGHGLIFTGPMTAIGLSLLGAGMCAQAHKAAVSVEATKEEKKYF